MAKYVNNAGHHPHPLELREGTEDKFRCHLCCCSGYGSFYGCRSCDFRAHDACARGVPGETTFTFFGHPQHTLALYPEADADAGRRCDLCQFYIYGLHYGCRLCGVFLHPVCATLPPAADSPVHPQHLITLVPSTGCALNCAGCDKADNEGWRYVCAPCGVQLHPWCLLGEGKDEDEVNTPLCIR